MLWGNIFTSNAYHFYPGKPCAMLVLFYVASRTHTTITRIMETNRRVSISMVHERISFNTNNVTNYVAFYFSVLHKLDYKEAKKCGRRRRKRRAVGSGSRSLWGKSENKKEFVHPPCHLLKVCKCWVNIFEGIKFIQNVN